MVMRVAAVEKFQYEKCKEVGLWGDEKSSVKRWKVGDLLVFKEGSTIRGIAKVVGEAFKDDLLIWDNGFYPNRIEIEIVKEFDEVRGKEVFTIYRESMLAVYGNKYGWVVLNKQPIESGVEAKIRDFLGEPNYL